MTGEREAGVSFPIPEALCEFYKEPILENTSMLIYTA